MVLATHRQTAMRISWSVGKWLLVLPLLVSASSLPKLTLAAIPASTSEKPVAGVQITPGLQFMVGDGSQAHLDLAGSQSAIHRVSGGFCPLSLVDGAIKLHQVDATARTLHCAYREGPDLAFKPDARIKYRLLIVRESGSVGVVMKDLVASARQALAIASDKIPPLPTGEAPQPQAAQFWTLRDGSVQGVWLMKKGSWMTRLQVDYPGSDANDAEARAVAQALFQPSQAPVRPPR